MPSRGRGCSPRGAGSRAAASGGGAAAQTEAGFTEPYSFFNLAKAEFPDDWTSPTARVRYEDSPLDLALMAWFMRKIAMAIDTPMPRNISYDEFIALCFVQMKGRDPNGQRDITLGIMKSLMPPGGDKVFRKLFPTTKWSLELNAVITKVVFAWMVGPMEVESTAENDLVGRDGDARLIDTARTHARHVVGAPPTIRREDTELLARRSPSRRRRPSDDLTRRARRCIRRCT